MGTLGSHICSDIHIQSFNTLLKGHLSPHIYEYSKLTYIIQEVEWIEASFIMFMLFLYSSIIPVKPIHNRDIVSVHFNNFIAWDFVTN